MKGFLFGMGISGIIMDTYMAIVRAPGERIGWIVATLWAACYTVTFYLWVVKK